MSEQDHGEAAPAELDPALLAILACPACRGAVSQDGSTVRCGGCGRTYPVRGVPVMLVEESQPGD